MPSGAKKRKKAKKQKKDGSSLPESSMDSEKNTNSKVQEEHDEDPSTPKTPVRENEPGDRDRTSQTDEWVEVLDLDVGGFPSQVLELVAGPDTTEDDKNLSDNSRLLAGWETVSQVSNVERLDELERGGTMTPSKAENVEGEEGDLNLKFEDGLNMSQGKGAESIASDWDLTESSAEINSREQSMQHMKEEANLCDSSSGSDRGSVSECMLEITEDATSFNLQCSDVKPVDPEGPVLESDVKRVDPLLNVTEDRAQEYVETQTDRINENSPARCYGWSCEASSAVDSYVSEPHESCQFMESMEETKDHEDVEDETCVTSKSDRVEPSLSSPKEQAEFSDNEMICDEKADGRSHTITTEESNLSPDVHSSNLAVESTHEMECTVNSEEMLQRTKSEVTGEDDKQPDGFEVEAYAGWFPVDARRDDVISSKDNASHFNEISEVDYPTVETVRQAVDDVTCLESKSNSGVANEDSRSLFLVENLSCSKEEPINFTTVTEVTHANVLEVADLSELSGSGKIAERINENATVKGLSSVSNLCGFLESSIEFGASDHWVTHPHSKAAHSMEEGLLGAAESVLVVAEAGEPTDVFETSEIAKPIGDTLSMKLLTERIPESDLLTRCNNMVEPVLDNLRGGASYLNLATSAEIVEHGKQNEEVSKQEAIDENPKSNEGLSSQSVVGHPEASELNSLSNIESAEQNQLNVNKSYDYQNDGRTSWKGCCGVFDWLSGRRG